MPKLNLNFKKGDKIKVNLKMKLIAIASLCFIFILIWFVVISKYQSGKSSNIISQGALLQSSYKSKYQYLVDLQDAAKKTDAAQKIAAQVAEKLLPVTNKISPIDAITQLGNEEKLKFVFFKPKPVERRSDYQITPMDVSLYGSFDGVIRFMQKLNKADSTIIITDFAIMRRGEDANDIIMNATLKIYNGISEADKKAALDAANAEAAKKAPPPPKVNKNAKK